MKKIKVLFSILKSKKVRYQMVVDFPIKLSTKLSFVNTNSLILGEKGNQNLTVCFS